MRSPSLFIWLESATMYTLLAGVKHLRQYLQTLHRNFDPQMLNPLYSFVFHAKICLCVVRFGQSIPKLRWYWDL